MEKKRSAVHPKVANGIAIVVTLVWAVSFLVDLLPSYDYSPSPYLHGLMLLVAGSALGFSVWRNGNR